MFSNVTTSPLKRTKSKVFTESDLRMSPTKKASPASKRALDSAAINANQMSFGMKNQTLGANQALGANPTSTVNSPVKMQSHSHHIYESALNIFPLIDKYRSQFHEPQSIPQEVRQRIVQLLAENLSTITKTKQSQNLEKLNTSKMSIFEQFLKCQAERPIDQKTMLREQEISVDQTPPYYIISQFWLQVAKKFMQQYPFCSFQTAVELIKLHIQTNIKLYFNQQQQPLITIYDCSKLCRVVFVPKTNSNPCKYLVSFQTKHYSFTQKMQELYQLLKEYASYINGLIRQYPMLEYLQHSQTVFDNLFITLKCLLSFDLGNSRKVSVRLSNSQKLTDIVIRTIFDLYKRQRIMLRVHSQIKSPKFFTHENVIKILPGIDSLLHLLSETSTNRIIELTAMLILESPFDKTSISSGNMGKSIRKTIQNFHSTHFQPFKWLAHLLTSRSDGYNYLSSADDEKYSNDYTVISGTIWLPLATVFIQLMHQKQHLPVGHQFKEMLFYLVCSIIDHDPTRFWQGGAEYEGIYIYLEMLGQQLISHKLEFEVGRVMRLMRCCCSHSAHKEGDQIQANRESKSVFKVFVNNILSSQNRPIDNMQFYAEYVLPLVVDVGTDYRYVEDWYGADRQVQQQYFQSEQVENFRPKDPYSKQLEIYRKYSYEANKTCYELLVKLCKDCDDGLQTLCRYYNDTYLGDQGQSLTQFALLNALTIEYMETLNRKSENVSSYQEVSYANYLKENMIPPIFELLTACLNRTATATSQSDRAAVTLIERHPNLQSVFEPVLKTQKSIKAFTDHIVNLNQTVARQGQYKQIIEDYLDNICVPIMQRLLIDRPSEVLYGFYARIVTSSLKKQLHLSDKSIHLLANKTQHFNTKHGYQKSTQVQRPALLTKLAKNSEQLIEFLSHCLRVQENSQAPFVYENILFNSDIKTQEILSHALQLLEMLIIFYFQNYSSTDRLIPQKIRRYLSILQPNKGANSDRVNSHFEYSNIILGNNQSVALPAALAYLVMGTGDNREIQQRAMNILTMIICFSGNSLSQTVPSRINIDFNVYEFSLASNNHNQVRPPSLQSLGKNDRASDCRIHCSAYWELIDHLLRKLSVNTNNGSTQHFGYQLDLLLLLVEPMIRSPTSNFSQPMKQHTSKHRLLGQSQIFSQLYKIVTHRLMLVAEQQSSDDQSIRTQAPLTNKQVGSYSRFVLYLIDGEGISATSKDMGGSQDHDREKLVLMFMDVVAQDIYKLMSKAIINKKWKKTLQLTGDDKLHFETLVTNFFRVFRKLQTHASAKTNPNTELLAELVGRYFGIIFHPYLLILNIGRVQQTRKIEESMQQLSLHTTSTDFQLSQINEQYLIGIELILCSRSYLNKQAYHKIMKSEDTLKILLEFAMGLCEYPQYYMLLVYAIDNYLQLQQMHEVDQKTPVPNMFNSPRSVARHRDYGFDSDESQEDIGQPNILDTQFPISNKLHDGNHQHINQLKSVWHAICEHANFRDLATNQADENGQQQSNMERISLVSLILQLSSNAKSSATSDMVKDCARNIILNFSPKNLMHKQRYTNCLIEQSLLFNIFERPSPDIVDKAIDMCVVSQHPITFISVANCLYNAAGSLVAQSLQAPSAQSDYLETHSYNSLNNIIELCHDMLNTNKQTQDQFEHSSIMCMKAWACTILNAIMGHNNAHRSRSQQIDKNIVEIIFRSNVLLIDLGQLLSGYGRSNINWPYSTAIKIKSQLNLVEKQYLLTILKLMSTVMSNHEIWQKSYEWDPRKSEQRINHRFNQFCKAMIESSDVLEPKYPCSNSTTPSHYNKYRSQNTYQLQLQQITFDDVLYPRFAAPNNRKQKQEIQLQIKAIKSTLFPFSNTLLDFVHEHLNTMISERYVMILLACYELKNLDVSVNKYEPILHLLRRTSQQILELTVGFDRERNKVSLLNKEQLQHHRLLDYLETKVWKSYQMTENLMYLNLLEEPLEDQIDLLNNLLETVVVCCIKLKQNMQLHKDFRDFNDKVCKIFKHLKNNQSKFRFDLLEYVEMGGFDNKSHLGTSTNMAPSLRINR